MADRKLPPPAPTGPPGLAARALAMRAVDGVLTGGTPPEEAFETARLEPRDLALARMIAGVALRRYGSIRRLLGALLARGLPRKAGPLEAILVTGAAQILFLDVPDRAAVDIAVRLAHVDARAQAFSGLVNAVLRKLSAEKAERLATLEPEADAPAWLFARWAETYGEAEALAMATVHRAEPALDLTVREDAPGWAARLGGIALPTGSVRLAEAGAIPALAGFGEGAWWVQDAAAALPARLLGDVAGQRIADLCAAPGGKTAQLAAAGARVTALDRSEVRLARLRENLKRLGLEAEIVVADAARWRAPSFDAVLLDAPCSATGTLRRHPDVAWSKAAADIATLAGVQRRLLDNAAGLVRPGGRLVYCTCSLEREEGEDQIVAFLARHSAFRRVPVASNEIGGLVQAVTPDGDLRTRPTMMPHTDPRLAGLDGFFAARLERIA